MATIKRYLFGVGVAVIALLFALVGKLKVSNTQLQRQQAQREADAQKAARDELERRQKAQVAAQQAAQDRRDKVEQAVRAGKRDYFDQD